MTASPDEGDLGNPQWSPGGTRILFTWQVDVGGGQTGADPFRMRADGTDVIRVTEIREQRPSLRSPSPSQTSDRQRRGRFMSAGSRRSPADGLAEPGGGPVRDEHSAG